MRTDLDIPVQCGDIDVRVKLECGLARNLWLCLSSIIRDKDLMHVPTHYGLGSLHVLFLEQELAIKITEVDGVKVEYFDQAF